MLSLVTGGSMPMRRVEHRNDRDQEHIRRRQEREVTSEDPEFIVHTRAVDHSFWLRVSYLLDKYKLLWWILVAFLISLGFDFRTPASNYKMLSTRIDTVASRVDSMFAENRKAALSRDKIETKLDVLITFRCLEQNQRDLVLAGVDCSKFTVNQKVSPK
jgi:hypothetical protein